MYKMKRILFLLAIVFLVSCSNQQEAKEKADAGNVNTEQQALESEETPATEPGTIILEPEKADPDQAEQQILGGGQSSAEIAKLFRQGTTAFDNGDFNHGIKMFNQIIAKDPNDGRAYYNLGVGYFKIDKYGESIKAFTSAIKISPRDSLALQYRGRVYYMMGNFKNALTDYDRVVELKPNDPIAYYNRGTARGRINDYTGAILDFDRALELDPEYAEVYYNRGLANFYKGFLHEACFDWRKAHSLGHYEADKALKEYCEGGGE